MLFGKKLETFVSRRCKEFNALPFRESSHSTLSNVLSTITRSIKINNGDKRKSVLHVRYTWP